MKQIRIILSMAIAVFGFTAINAQSTKTKNKTAVADTVVYQCPMKCEGDKTYDKAGKCPKCNMDLKAVPKPVAAIYQCPMKCEGDKTYDKAVKCPKCNMNLTKVKTKKEVQNHKGQNHN
ncbi:Cu2+-exporting ATPase [Lacibacter cauensis]|jgi:transcription initiation factor IIE alpha subunit|uniref:Cu2+-exporting ATPase n=1 Tax=Lacibacter cauensis TaxID=510947 RepID=A0A562S8J5_9BACT|nr:heavy metal-binding domain-containing protein [Lacibacter cauensis]TWI77689.1 Cu2+-exporting ATPase [Lacibacter cauensis]